jgi:hypothetical protein
VKLRTFWLGLWFRRDPTRQRHNALFAEIRGLRPWDEAA